MKRSSILPVEMTCIAAAALVAVLAIVGCTNGGIKLDRETSFVNMNFMVPSTWSEKGNNSYIGSGEFIHFSDSESDEDIPDDRMSVFCDYADDMDAEEEAMEFTGVESLDDIDGEILDSGVIDGAEYIVLGFDRESGPWSVAFIENKVYDYEITVFGDKLNIMSVVKSITFE